MKYCVKTKQGYYYSVGNGRYGRVDGDMITAWVLCEKHANQIVAIFNNVLPGIKAVKEELNGTEPCTRCEVAKNKLL